MCKNVLNDRNSVRMNVAMNVSNSFKETFLFCEINEWNAALIGMFYSGKLMQMFKNDVLLSGKK